MATESKPSSFLAGVKSEITDLFAAAYDEMSSDFGEDVPAVIGESMQRLQKKAWEVVEKRLKESYLNGRKATNGKPTERKPRSAPDTPPVAETRNPFRKT